MSVYRSLLVLTGCLLPALAGSATVQAQTVDERLFMVYVLEDFYRTTFPPNQRAIRSSQEIQRFLDTRRLLVDQLRRQVLESRTRDPELLQAFRAYRELLNRSETLAGKLKEREDSYFAFFRKLRKDVLELDEQGRSQTSNHSLDNASEAVGESFRKPVTDTKEAVASGVFAGMSSYRMAEARQKRQLAAALKNANLKVAAYESEHRPRFQEDLQTIYREFFKTFDKERRTAVQQAARQVQELADKYKWRASECEFDPDRPLSCWEARDQPRNPFRVKAHTLEGPRDEQDTLQLLAQTQECLGAIKFIPTPSLDGYKRIRAEFYAMAGLLANQANRADIGLTGFKDALKNPAKGAVPAQLAWKLYFDVETADGDPRGFALHQRVLAHAYGGKLTEAMTILNRGRLEKLQSGNPTFWFDLARIVSLNGANLQQQLTRNPGAARVAIIKAQLMKHRSDALYCLRMALGTGLQNKNEIRTSPDLEWIRALAGDDFEKSIGLMDE